MFPVRYKMYEASTADLDPHDLQLLSKHASYRHKDNCGYIDVIDETESNVADHLQSLGYSDKYIAVYAAAKAYGADWLMIDADGKSAFSSKES